MNIPVTTRIKASINRLLCPFNLHLGTLTAMKYEENRLRKLAQRGYFEAPAFPVPPSIDSCDPRPILERVFELRSELRKLEEPLLNEVGYSYDNEYYSSPDTEVLYAMVEMLNPEIFLEVGSGNSTRIVRQAIIDHGLDTHILSIDPYPRSEIDHFSDRTFRCRAEDVCEDVYLTLGDGDILFVDSSHEINTGNDVSFLYLRIMPELTKGVVIHIHDVFLPFEYPKSWIMDNRWKWNEQYIVQAILSFSDSFEVLWAGYYLQHRMDLSQYFEHCRGRRAQSLWLRKK